MPLTFRHLVSASQITRPDADFLVDRSIAMEEVLAGSGSDVLKGKILATLFYEPSTRTRLSFETAMYRLGGQVITADGIGSSSLKKGESIEDTMRMAGAYADCIVMRHPQSGIAEVAAGASPVPFINGGDGGNEHPTQGLLDLLTIQRERGTRSGLHVAFGCDPKHSRTIRSLVRLLCLYEGNRFTFIGPPSLRMSDDVLSELKQRGVAFEETDDPRAGVTADVLYMNRLQQERFEDPAEFERLRRNYVLTASMLQGSTVTIMDPLPRVDEIAPDVDLLPNAAYFRQARNGLLLRMALLESMLAA